MAKQTYEKVGWQNESTGNTPVSSENLEHMDSALKYLYDEGATSKDIFICGENQTIDDAPAEAKIIIDSNIVNTKPSEIVNSMAGNETNKGPSVNAIKNFITGFEIGDNYIKFENGLLVCWGQKVSGGVPITNQWGSIYSSGSSNPKLKFDDFPIPFTEIPTITYTSRPDFNNSWFMADDGMKPTTKNPGGVQLLRGTSNNECSAILNYIAIGRWK